MRFGFTFCLLGTLACPQAQPQPTQPVAPAASYLAIANPVGSARVVSAVTSNDYERRFVGEIGAFQVHGRLVRAGKELFGEYAYEGKQESLYLRDSIASEGIMRFDEHTWVTVRSGSERKA